MLTQPARNSGVETFLTFRLASEEFGIAVLKVKEIVAMLDITTVPRTSPFIRGVVNLRGRILPVFDLRVRFELPEVEAQREACIVVIDSDAGDVGVLVDSVRDVVEVRKNEVERPASHASPVLAKYLLGTSRAGGRIQQLLDVERVLSRRVSNVELPVSAREES